MKLTGRIEVKIDLDLLKISLEIAREKFLKNIAECKRLLETWDTSKGWTIPNIPIRGLIEQFHSQIEGVDEILNLLAAGGTVTVEQVEDEIEVDEVTPE